VTRYEWLGWLAMFASACLVLLGLWAGMALLFAVGPR
jgi:hypothetical protein